MPKKKVNLVLIGCGGIVVHTSLKPAVMLLAALRRQFPLPPGT